MHSFHGSNVPDRPRTTIHYNSDLSGAAYVTAVAPGATTDTPPMRLPARDLVQFGVAVVRATGMPLPLATFLAPGGSTFTMLPDTAPALVRVVAGPTDEDPHDASVASMDLPLADLVAFTAERVARALASRLDTMPREALLRLALDTGLADELLTDS